MLGWVTYMTTCWLRLATLLEIRHAAASASALRLPSTSWIHCSSNRFEYRYPQFLNLQSPNPTIAVATLYSNSLPVPSPKHTREWVQLTTEMKANSFSWLCLTPKLFNEQKTTNNRESSLTQLARTCCCSLTGRCQPSLAAARPTRRNSRCVSRVTLFRSFVATGCCDVVNTARPGAPVRHRTVRCGRANSAAASSYNLSSPTDCHRQPQSWKE